MRLAFVLLCALGVASATARAATLPSHAGMYPANATATTAPSLALVDSHVEVSVRGAMIEVIVRQTFRSDADHVTEATYIFPLPDDAAVTAMAITSGARTIHAEVDKRADAQKRYEDAIAAGVGAALLEQERPDVFTQTVSAIPAHGTVEITLRYDTLARPRGDGNWELALPMVVAPRYVPGVASGRPTTGAGHAPDTDRAPDASRVTPGAKPGAGGSTDVTLAFADAVEDVTSPTHELSARGGGYEFGDAHSDHDALIRWRGKQPASGWVEQDDDGGYAAAVVSAPPGKSRAAGAAAIDVAVILDRSAAAHGDADATARPFVRELLASLTPADGVTVTGSVTLARQAPIDAWRDLDRSWATSPGAFDLTRALHAAAHGGAIVLVTPGLVADDAAALAEARALHAPVHVIGVGPAPNRALLSAIARDTGGTIRFVAPDDDLAATARDVLADVTAPPAALAINWGTLAASEVVPATMPRLGAGQARLVLARVQHVQAANGRAQGDVFAIAIVTKPPAVAGELTPRGALARRWARDKLGEQLDAAHPDVAAVTALALHYGLVSPYTSMVAIGDEVVVRGGVKHTVSVPVAVPAGMRWQPLEQELHVATKGEHEREDAGKKEADKPRNVVVHNAPTPKPTPTTTPAPVAVKPPTRPKSDQSRAPHTPPAAPPPPPPPAATQPSPAVVVDAKRPTVNQAPAPASTAAEPSSPSSGASVAAGPRPSGGDDAGDELDSTKVAPEEAPAPEASTDADDDQVTASVRHYRVVHPNRIGLSVGGGLTFDPTALVAIAARIELGASGPSAVPRLGGEATLWLVGGLHAQEIVLATLAWRIDHTTLGVGAGVHVSDANGAAIGPALGLVLRHDLTRRLGGYLRYDGALLFEHGGHAGEHAASAGVEWRW